MGSSYKTSYYSICSSMANTNFPFRTCVYGRSRPCELPETWHGSWNGEYKAELNFTLSDKITQAAYQMFLKSSSRRDVVQGECGKVVLKWLKLHLRWEMRVQETCWNVGNHSRSKCAVLKNKQRNKQKPTGSRHKKNMFINQQCIQRIKYYIKDREHIQIS